MKNILFCLILVKYLFCYSPVDWLQNLSNELINKDCGLYLSYKIINGEETSKEKYINLFYHNPDSVVIDTENRKVVTHDGAWSIYDKKSKQIFIDFPDKNLKEDILNIVEIIIKKKYSIKKISNDKIGLVVEKYNIPISINVIGEGIVTATAQINNSKIIINNISIYNNNFREVSKLPDGFDVINFTK